MVKCRNSQKSTRPPLWQTCKVLCPWMLFRETTVHSFSSNAGKPGMVSNGTEWNRTLMHCAHVHVDVVKNWAQQGTEELISCSVTTTMTGQLQSDSRESHELYETSCLGSSTTCGGIDTTLLLFSMGESGLRFLPWKRDNHQQRAMSTPAIAYWLWLSLYNLGCSMLYRCLLESEIGLLSYWAMYL